MVYKIKKNSKYNKLKSINSKIDGVSLLKEEVNFIIWLARKYDISPALAFKTAFPEIPNKSREIINKSYFYQSITIQKQRINAIKTTTEKINKEVVPILLHYSNENEKNAVVSGLIQKNKKQILIIVPEKKDVFELASIYKKKSPILIYSGLSKNETWQNWLKIKQNRCKLIIGTKTAIFVPPDNLGLIIIDHEEDRSQINYDQKPKYAIVDIAQKKINSNKSIKLLLTSPAPSITAYHHFKHYNLHCNQFIKAHLINLKEERLNGNYALFTEQLIDSIKKNLRSLLIYNKKGDVRLLLCQNCKEVVPSSIVSCPFCHSLNFKNISYGIKKLKKDLEKIFSDKKIIAIEKNGVEKDINNNWDIAIGTEYALRIIDINMVNFIALISVDHQLAVPDYQASERVWQLIRKIINFNKKCSIQTNSMNNIVIQSAINNDYLSFYHHELATRKKFHYPPFDKNDTNSV